MLSYLSVNRCERNAQEYFGFAEDTRQGEYAKHKFQKIRRNISPFGEDARQGEYAKHKFKKYAGLSKWSQRGGLENLSAGRTIKS